MDHEAMEPASQREQPGWRAALPSVTHLVILGGIIALAMAARMSFWWVQARSGAVPPGDPEEYYRAALHILHGGYHDTGKWLRPPVYPALLAVLLPLAGMNVAGALFLQAMVLSVGVLAFYAAGTQLFGRQDVGLVTALLAAFYVPLASYASSLYAEALFAMLLALALAMLDRALVSGTGRAALGAGALLGLAALTRAVGVYLIPLVVVWTAWLAWRAQGAPGARYRVAATLMLGAAFIIGPWAARNYVIHGRLILSDTNGGISMWYGTVRDDAEQEAGEARLAVVSNLADRQALALRMAWDNIQADPVRFLARMRFKIASLYGLQTRSYAVGDVISIDSRGMQMVQNAGEYRLALTLLADAQYSLLMPLAIAGICFAPRRERAVPTILWVGLATLLAALTIGHPRLRLPIVAALLPFAAYALTILPGVGLRVRALLRDRRSAAALAVMIVFFALTGSLRYLPWLSGMQYAVPGRLALEQRDQALAEMLLTRARTVDQGNPLRTIDLADAAFEYGQYEAALALYREAAALEPRSLYAHAMRAALAVRTDRPDEARAAMQAIDGYWRSGNDLLEWAWTALLVGTPPRVVPGDPSAIGLYAGFAPATPDLTVGRWTLGDGRVRVRGGCGALVINLYGPVGRVVQVTVDEGGIQEQVTLNGAPQEVRLPVASVRDCEYGPPLTVRLRSATSLLDLEAAPWYVGVAVREVRAEP